MYDTRELLASAFLIVVAAVPLLWAAMIVVRSHYTPLQFFFWFINLMVVRFRWRAKIPAMPLAAGQGAILVSNHRSSMDPCFLAAVADRPIHWLVAKEYYDHPVFAWFMKLAEAIPVSRGGVDTAATKQAIRLAEADGLIGMFPEGRINMSDDLLLPCRPGAVTIAIKSQKPLLPCYIEGAPFNRTPLSPLFMPARVRVRFGRPIDVTRYQGREREQDVVRQLALDCLKRIAELAGQPDFQPTLSGRNWKPSAAEVARMADEADRRRRNE